MTYVYDLVLNFNSNYYEFYEWNKEDVIYHIKKINLIKISSDTYNDFLNNKVIVNDEFLLSIFNKCEYFSNRSVETIPYSVLVTDSYRVMGIVFDRSGNIIKYSSLLLDEEEDVLGISDRLGIIKIDYQIKAESDRSNNLTRFENHIIKYIKKDLYETMKNNNVNKLKYLYYEYFNKECDDIKKIYESLINELDNVNEKHYNLYNLIKLSCIKKNV